MSHSSLLTGWLTGRRSDFNRAAVVFSRLPAERARAPKESHDPDARARGRGVPRDRGVGALEGLDNAQAKALDPLSSIGTDLTVTLAPESQDARRGGFFGGAAVRRRPRGGTGEPVGDHRPLQARQAGRPLRPRLLPTRYAADLPAELRPRRSPRSPGSPRSPAASSSPPSTRRERSRRSWPGSRRAATRSRSNRRLRPPTPAEFQKIQACLQKAGDHVGAPTGGRQNGQNGQGGVGGGQQPQGGFRAGGNRDAFASACPRGCGASAPRSRRRRRRCTGDRPAPDEHREPELHDRRRRPEDPEVGVVTPALVTRGRFIAAAKGRASTRRSPQHVREPEGAEGRLKLNLNGTVFTVVGSCGRRSAARRPTSTCAAAAPGARKPEGLCQRSPRPRRERRLRR